MIGYLKLKASKVGCSISPLRTGYTKEKHTLALFYVWSTSEYIINSGFEIKQKGQS